jgi:hypothetical protein
MALVSQREWNEYGAEAMNTMGKRALDVVTPVVKQLASQNQQLAQQVQRLKANEIYQTLDRELPQWREVNKDSRWLNWLAEPHAYARTTKQHLLDDAFNSGDTSRVLAIMQGFLSEYGQQSKPRSRSSSAWSTRGSQRATDRPTFSRKQIEMFYEENRRAAASGKPPDPARMQMEAAILAAAREGRITN